MLDLAEKGDNSKVDAYIGDVIQEGAKGKEADETKQKDDNTSAFYTDTPKDMLAFNFGNAPGKDLSELNASKIFYNLSVFYL